MSITFALQRPCDCVNRSVIIMEITGREAPVQWKMACLFGRRAMQQNAIHFLTWQFFFLQNKEMWWDDDVWFSFWCDVVCYIKAVELKMLLVFFFWFFLSGRMIGYATSNLFSWHAYFFCGMERIGLLKLKLKDYWKKCLGKK